MSTSTVHVDNSQVQLLILLSSCLSAIGSPNQFAYYTLHSPYSLQLNELMWNRYFYVNQQSVRI